MNVKLMVWKSGILVKGSQTDYLRLLVELEDNF